MIINGDALHELKKMENDSIDLVCTDPPYGYSFMGKDWDKAVPSVEIWQECLRVLKPGAFCFVMSAPRSDVQNAMISRLMEAGFRLDFTPIYWTYASGFPKAGNIGKLVDKRLGAEREVVSSYERSGRSGGILGKETTVTRNIDKPSSDQAKALDGSYAGFQPKPAVEVIIVAMKPLSEKTFVDQALKNGKGITWLDDCRVPTGTVQPIRQCKAGSEFGQNSDWNDHKNIDTEYDPNNGRFPANLLVSDDVLNDGVVRKARNPNRKGGKPNMYGFEYKDTVECDYADSGSYSRYFDLDKWATTLPFLIVPKASKSEKNKGLGHIEPKLVRNSVTTHNGTGDFRGVDKKPLSRQSNHHPTVKPLKLMSYLITLGSRKGDVVLDPFCGSGTTCLAAKKLNRNYIGIEREEEYVEIAKARISQEVQGVLL